MALLLRSFHGELSPGFVHRCYSDGLVWLVVKIFCTVLRIFDLLLVKLFHILLSQSYISCWGYYFLYLGFVGLAMDSSTEKMNCFENVEVAWTSAGLCHDIVL